MKRPVMFRPCICFLLSRISFLLILLWSYAAVIKLSDIRHSRMQMLNQVFPAQVAEVLVWLIPLTELSATFLLAFVRSRKLGLYLSLVLMTAFSGYIILVLLHVFSRVPCSCGGILERMSWAAHLVFNLFFLLLILIALSFNNGWFSLNNLFTYGRKGGKRQRDQS